MKTTRYGVISDIHGDPRIAYKAVDTLKNEGIDKLLVNGDMGQHQETLQASQSYIATVLDAVAKSGLEAYVQPGSHESQGAYIPVVRHFRDNHSNIVDTLQTPKIESGDHELIFLPGSDALAGGEFRIVHDHPTGAYAKMGQQFAHISSQDQLQQLAQRYNIDALELHINMGYIKDKVSDPEKSILVCHIPRRFDNPDTCVDMAHFGEAQEEFSNIIYEKKDGERGQLLMLAGEGNLELTQKLSEVQATKVLNREVKYKNMVFPFFVAEHYIKMGAPITERMENRGNEYLGKLLDELGITKQVNGHFHESAHRANDNQGNHVKQGEFVDELYWNSGHLDVGQTGILHVRDGKVAYQNINIR